METTTPPAFRPLPLGAVRPAGWLRDQLRVQADGLSGHLDEFWPDVADSKWIGGRADGWERGPYWLDGFVPLAVLLGDERLLAKAHRWVDHIVANQHADGWLGAPDEEGGQPGTGVARARDPWPLFIVIKALAQWQEATGDARIVTVLLRTMRAIDALLDAHPLESWAKMRWMDLAVGVLWLHERAPGEGWLLDLGRKAAAQGYDWRAHFADFVYTGKQSEKWTLENHVVNHAMGLKEEAVRSRLGLGGSAETAAGQMATLDRFHGQVTGVFSGDESLAGTSPSQGTELCSVVEYLYSLEHLLAAFGHAEFADRWERIAFNALPATFTDDMCAHQYVQQANQVVCRLAPDGERVYTNNGPDSNLFGLEPHFGCCTANLHQGWPKFAAHLWMLGQGGEMVAWGYAPCEVDSAAPGVRLLVGGEYPFRERVTVTVRTAAPAARLALLLRIPGWAEGARVEVGGESTAATPGEFARIEREWRDGDTVTLTLPMRPRLEERPATGAVAVTRGPLVFGLRIGEEFRPLPPSESKGAPPFHDREVHPTTPWNWALAAASPAELAVSESPVSAVPFAAGAPPVTITAPARRVPGWVVEHNAAAPVPERPETEGPAETVTLVPYGSTHLRIAEFPKA